MADVPLDAISLATMHVILGVRKNLYNWLLRLLGRLEKLEEEKTIGNVTDQFCHGIMEAKDNARN